MTRTVRLSLLCLAAALCALVATLGIAWMKLVPNDQEVAQRMVEQAEARLGVKVTIGTARLQLWPRPVFVIEDVQTVQPQPIKIRRLVAQADLVPLLHGRLQLEHLLVDGALVPQLSLRALKIRPEPGKEEADADPAHDLKLDFNDVVWVTRHGVPLEFSGNALFAPGWRLREAEVVRAGVKPAVRLALSPQGSGRWKVDLQLGGGTADGEVTLKTAGDGAITLTGQLSPRNVDVEAALSGFKRRSALLGRASGQTTLSARGNGIGELARSLRTNTEFTVASPTLLHVDIDKALRTLGQDRAGQTALLSLAGSMETQNTADGIVVRYTGLQAKGQSFSASGHGTIARRQVNGELTIDVAGGLVGVPLKVSGPLAHPQVSMNMSAGAVTGAAAGAVIGTALLPGIGTAVGAGVGAAVGKLFGASPSR